MGAKNVSAAYVLWAHLDHAPFRLLVGMALQSLDQASPEGRPARTWFGGEEALTELLGRSRRMTYKALAALRASGAIEVVEVGRNRHRAVYRLHLDPMASVHLKDTHKREPQVHKKGAPEVQNRVHLSGTPRSTEEGTKESREGDTSPPAVVSPAPDAPVDNPEFDEMTTEQANRELIKRHGLEHGVNLLAQHAAVHPECENPAGHLLASTRGLRVIEGGKTA